MVKVRSHYRNNIFAKPAKVYVTGLILLVLLTIFFFLWKTPEEKSIREEHKRTNYMFNEYGQNEFTSKGPAFQGEKIVHIDLKGAPPKILYYSKLFPLFSKLGATGVLLEYEDMFPYSGELANISALNAYTLEDIATINQLAKKSNLKVIPLIQTFGHMEFILKLAEYKEFREVTTYPQVICPTHENTIRLITSMLEQIVEAHPDSEMIHIGADEVYYLGVCNRCANFMQKYNLSKDLLFIEHVNSIAGIMNRLFPDLRILMWDDQFRSIKPKDVKIGNLNKNIEPVIWKYSKEVYDELGPTLWEDYKQMFTKVWVASAFKGATASNDFVSLATHYLQNHRSWISLMAEYKGQFNFQGIIITGWQRYDHFAVLCELLPVGIPSLAMSLRLLLGFNDSPLSPPTEVAKILQCEQPYALIGPAFGSPKCSFPGGDILENVLHIQQLKQEYESILEDSRVRGWMSGYNIAHAFSSPSYVERATSSLARIKSDLEQIDTDMTSAMGEIYDKFTIEEWKDTYLRPLVKNVNVLWDARVKLLAKETWPRRPLTHEEV